MYPLREMMTKDVVTLASDMTLREAVELLAEKRLSGAPVLEASRVVGVFSTSDLLTFAASMPTVPREEAKPAPWNEVEETPAEEGEFPEVEEAPGAFFADYWDDAGADTADRMAAVAGPEWDFLAEHEVGEAMTRRVFSLSPEVDVRQAADLMSRKRIHRVLVMQNGKLLGIVSALDITKAVAKGELVRKTYVFNARGEFDDRG